MLLRATVWSPFLCYVGSQRDTEPLLQVKIEPVMEAIAMAILKRKLISDWTVVQSKCTKHFSVNNREVKVHKGAACKSL